MGGNAFAKATPINLTDLPYAISALEDILDVPLTDSYIGSTGKKDIMGDIDLISPIPLDELEVKFSAFDVSSNKHKRITKVLFPVKSTFVQVDFLYGDKAWLKWAMQSATPSGAHRGNMLQAIAQHSGTLYRHKRKIVGRVGYSYDRAWGLRKVYQECSPGKNKRYIGQLRQVSKDQFAFPDIDIPNTIINVPHAKTILQINNSSYNMLVDNVKTRYNAHEIFETYKQIMKRNKLDVTVR